MEEKKILNENELNASAGQECIRREGIVGSYMPPLDVALESVKPLEIADLGDSSVTASRITVR